ncbi:WhiB family transcriptional regulator [Streptomyces sp. NPDC051684]|uniref:WhiB family transcriptional regulator n=1 Tax=Streptomyces sp. NPDC051684 TaxID=3365670 RepID=UPI0037A8B28A
MRLHDLAVDATTRYRAAPPDNDLQKINIASPRNVPPHWTSPQRSRHCPVIMECLRWAVATGQTTGVWGGASESERAGLLRAVRRHTRARATH